MAKYIRLTDVMTDEDVPMLLRADLIREVYAGKDSSYITLEGQEGGLSVAETIKEIEQLINDNVVTFKITAEELAEQMKQRFLFGNNINNETPKGLVDDLMIERVNEAQTTESNELVDKIESLRGR